MIEFTVYGTPRPQGSMRAFLPKHGQRPIVTSDNAQLKPWRQEVAAVALQQDLKLRDELKDKPISMSIVFYFVKPASAKKRVFPTVKPDIDKLERAILDALTGIVYNDDAQVVEVLKRKEYSADGEPASAWISISPMEAR